MTRRGRVDLRNHYYHILSRGQRKDSIFLDEYDKFEFINILKETVSECNVDLCAFVLMTNHYHLLLYRKNTTIEKFMRILNTKYAIYFNNRHKLTGHVFQDRCKSLIVLSERYLGTLIEYIHNNPVRKNMVEDACDYGFSSASTYNNGIIVYPFVRILFNEKAIKEKYNIEKITDKENEFVGKISEYNIIQKRKLRTNKEYMHRRKKDKCIDVDFKNVMEEFEDKKNIDMDSLSTAEKILIAKKLYKENYKQSEIAIFLKISKSAVSRWKNNKWKGGRNSTTVPAKEKKKC